MRYLLMPCRSRVVGVKWFFWNRPVETSLAIAPFWAKAERLTVESQVREETDELAWRVEIHHGGAVLDEQSVSDIMKKCRFC